MVLSCELSNTSEKSAAVIAGTEFAAARKSILNCSTGLLLVLAVGVAVGVAVGIYNANEEGHLSL